MAFMQHDASHFDNGEAYEPEIPDCRSTLEDLCRSHLVSADCEFLTAFFHVFFHLHLFVYIFLMIWNILCGYGAHVEHTHLLIKCNLFKFLTLGHVGKFGFVHLW